MKKVKLYHNNPSLKTLKELTEYNNIVFDKNYKLEDLFSDCRTLIFSQYSSRMKVDLASSLKKNVAELTEEDITINDTLPCPCYIIVDLKRLKYIVDSDKTEFQQPTNSVIAFQNDKIKEILTDPEATYKATKRVKSGVRVLGWFKSLYYIQKGESSNGNINDWYNTHTNFIDLSPIVVNMSTSVGQQGGQFNISFPHIPMYTRFNSNNVTSFSKDGKPLENTDYTPDNAIIGDMEVRQWIKENKILDKLLTSGQMDAYKAQGTDSIHIKSMVYSQDYISWLIQPNDLLFLSFSDMDEIEDDRLSGHSYDMICLVDTVSIQRNGQGNCSVSVQGRDLMKLLVEDASMYFPNSATGKYKDIFDNTEVTRKGGDLESVYEYDGATRSKMPRDISGFLEEFYERGELNLFTIEFVVKAVISKLANIQIVPNGLFTDWYPNRTTFDYLSPKKKEETKK